MAKWIHLTGQSGDDISVNVDLVATVAANGAEGSILAFDGRSAVFVQEQYKDLIQRLEHMAARGT